ncbi:MAG TPA: hypothetical protein VK886_10895 [Vicinamibacterales bacterium]|nr:hypothetical protein [Vicinamibacterales bacterium]
MTAVVLLGLLLQVCGAPPPPPAQAAPPAAEVYLARLEPSTDGNIRVESPENISNSPGYDNQPFFTPDGAAVLFTSNRDGKQTDIYRYDLAPKAIARLTNTPESEYSPVVTLAADRFSTIRVEADGTQRLWEFRRVADLAYVPELVLKDVKPVGYHAWADRDTLVLFVLGEPATLRVADVKTGRAEVVATRPGRCLARMPGGNISFVQKGAAKEPWRIVELDPRARRQTPLVETLDGREDYAWLPDGRLLMASGSKLFLWDRNDRVPVWKEVADLARSGLANITRLAVSPDGKRLAFVSDAGR